MQCVIKQVVYLFLGIFKWLYCFHFAASCTKFWQWYCLIQEFLINNTSHILLLEYTFSDVIIFITCDHSGYPSTSKKSNTSICLNRKCDFLSYESATPNFWVLLRYSDCILVVDWVPLSYGWSDVDWLSIFRAIPHYKLCPVSQICTSRTCESLSYYADDTFSSICLLHLVHQFSWNKVTLKLEKQTRKLQLWQIRTNIWDVENFWPWPISQNFLERLLDQVDNFSVSKTLKIKSLFLIIIEWQNN